MPNEIANPERPGGKRPAGKVAKDRWGYSTPSGTHRWSWGPFVITKTFTEPIVSYDMYILGTFIGCKYDLDAAKLRCESLAEACAEAL